MIIKPSLTFAVAASLGLTACVDSATRIQDPNYRAETGVAAGAVGGAVLGSFFKNDKNGALHGAILGGIAGGLVGNSLDQQAQEMRTSLGNPNVTVTNAGAYLLVNLPDDALFATGSATLRPDLQREIRSVANNLLSYPNSSIEVVGHTDNVGSAASNFDLSQRRAGSVANILIGAGVPPRRIAVSGRGEDQPVATNLSEAGRAQNRRVEIIIRPNN